MGHTILFTYDSEKLNNEDDNGFPACDKVVHVP